MAGTYKEIDIKNWDRAMHCEVFRHSLQPQYAVSFELDITNFLFKVKARRLSFTLAFVYAVSKCANEVEAFRYRFADGRVVLFDTIHTSFTYLNQETELFKVIYADMKDTMEEYIAEAAGIIEKQEVYFTGPPGNDIFQFSSLPWISFTHISHTESGKKDNAVPMFDWGKFYEKDGKTVLPFSVQAHHSFVDGIHIAKLAGALQRYLDAFC